MPSIEGTEAVLPGESTGRAEGLAGPPARVSGAHAARGGLLLQLSIQAGSMLSTVLLARVLRPADFGIVAMANSLLSLASLLAASGLSTALMRAKTDIDRRASTYFWTTAFASIALAGTLAAAAIPLTSLLGQAGAWRFVAVLAPVLVLSALTGVPHALLYRGRRFTAVYLSTGIGASVYFVSQVILALAGAGAWAVIWGQLLGAFVTLILAMMLGPWRPALTFRSELIREDLGYLGGTSLSQGLTYVIRNCDYWFISRWLGPAPLGAYYVAYVLPNILRLRVSWAVSSVLFVHVARTEDEPQELRRLWRQVWAMQAGVGLPALVGVALLSQPIIEVFFGHQWTAAASPMRVACFVALLDLHMVMVSTTAMALGLVAITVRVLVVRTVFCVVGVITALSVTASITSAALGVLAGCVAAIAVQELMLAKYMPVGIWLVWLDLLRFSAPAAIMTVAIVAFRAVVDVPAWCDLAASTLLGAVVYFGCGLVLFRQTFVRLLEDTRRLAVGR